MDIPNQEDIDVFAEFCSSYEDYMFISSSSYPEGQKPEKLEENIYTWLCDEVFLFDTGDSKIAEEVGKYIYETLNAIFERRTFEYLKESKEKYYNYILICQFLDYFRWIEWGTSIRGAFFSDFRSNPAREIIPNVPFTTDNIKHLLTFVESNIEK